MTTLNPTIAFGVALAGCSGLTVYDEGPGGLGNVDGVDGTLEGDTDTDTDTDTDLGTDSDTDTTPYMTDTGTPCVGPGEYSLTPQGPQGGTFTPIWFSLRLFGIADGTEIVDATIDGLPSTATAVFSFFDGDQTAVYICDAVFDASVSAISPSAMNPTEAGQQIIQAWEIDVIGNTGWTDCGTMNGFGTPDARLWVSTRQPWIFGLGDLVELRPVVESIVDDPVEWNNLWDPSVVGTFINSGAFARETGWALLYDHDCYDVDSTSLPQLAPTGGPLDSYVSGTGIGLVFNMNLFP